MLHNHRPNPLQRLFIRIGSSKIGATLFSPIMPTIDRTVLRLSNNRKTASALIVGAPIVTLTTRGRKSGQPRHTPLIGIPDEDDIILIASNWGHKQHAGWMYNVRANPTVKLTFQGETHEYTSREVTTASERAHCWRKAVAIYPGYDRYKARANREIPIFRLTPR